MLIADLNYFSIIIKDVTNFIGWNVQTLLMNKDNIVNVKWNHPSPCVVTQPQKQLQLLLNELINSNIYSKWKVNSHLINFFWYKKE